MSPEQTPYPSVEGYLTSLFEQARDTDELSFAAALLRLSEFAHVAWEPFDETLPLLEQCRDLLHAPLQGSFQIRLLLLLHSYLLELEDLHQVVLGMLLIVRKVPYVYPAPEPLPEALIPHAIDAGFEDLGILYRETLMGPIVEAFRTGRCSVAAGAVHLHDGKPVVLNDVPRRLIPFDYLVDRIDLAFTIAETVMRLTRRFRSEYTFGQTLTGKLWLRDVGQATAIVESGVGLVGLKPRLPPAA